MGDLLTRVRLFITVCESRIGVGADTISITGDNSVFRLLQDIRSHLEVLQEASSQLSEGGGVEEGSDEGVDVRGLEEVSGPSVLYTYEGDVSVGSTQSVRILTEGEWASQGFPTPCVVVSTKGLLSPRTLSQMRAFRMLSGEEDG